MAKNPLAAKPAPKANELVVRNPDVMNDVVSIIETAERVDPDKIDESNIEKAAEILARVRKALKTIEDEHKSAIKASKDAMAPFDAGRKVLKDRAEKMDALISNRLMNMYWDSDGSVEKKVTGTLGATLSFVTKKELFGELADITQVPEEYLRAIKPEDRIDWAKVNAVIAAGIAIPGITSMVKNSGHVRTIATDVIG